MDLGFIIQIYMLLWLATVALSILTILAVRTAWIGWEHGALLAFSLFVGVIAVVLAQVVPMGVSFICSVALLLHWRAR